MPALIRNIRPHILLLAILATGLGVGIAAWPGGRVQAELLSSVDDLVNAPQQVLQLFAHRENATTPDRQIRGLADNGDEIQLDANSGFNYPRIGLFGFVDSSGRPLVALDGTLDQAVINSYARRSLAIINVTPLTDTRTDIIPALRAANPTMKIFAYVHSSAVWCGPPGYAAGVFYRKTWELVESFDTDGTPYSDCDGTGDGFLWLQDGQPADSTGLNVNFAHQDGAGNYDIAEGYADLVYNDIYLKQRTINGGLWDGVFFDVYCYDPQFLDPPANHFDYARAGYVDAASFYAGWQAAHIALTTRLRALVGSDFPIVGNCGQGRPAQWPIINGWFRENFPFQDGGTWLSNMYREVGGYFFEENNFLAPRYNMMDSWPTSSAQPYTSTNRQRARYVLGSASLGSGYGFMTEPSANTAYDFQSWWYDEYAVNSAGESSALRGDTGWLGQPTTDAYQYFGTNNNPDLITGNNGFESGPTGWQLFVTSPAAATGGVEAGTGPDGSAAYHATVTSVSPFRYFVKLRAPNNLTVSSGVKYGISFWAKASSFRAMSIALAPDAGGAGSAEMGVPIDPTWKRYEFPLTPTASGTFYFRFDVGTETGDLWLDQVSIKVGMSSLYRRDFDHGSLFINPDTVSHAVTLDHPFKKILGTLAPEVNDGSVLCATGAPLTCTLTLNAADAIFLLNHDDQAPAAVTNLTAR